jgi:hypothetical protein
MDRRTFLCETGGALLGAACHAHRDEQDAEPHARVCIAVFDPARVEGRWLAQRALRAGIAAWPVSDDIGLIWHTQIARRAGPRMAMIAALRPSDQFVLTRLAAARGAVVLAV